jgi:hypothetical protein
MTDMPRDAEDQQRDSREERLAAQLRANLQKRKAQARARRSGEADPRPDGLPAAPSHGKPADRS